MSRHPRNSMPSKKSSCANSLTCVARSSRKPSSNQTPPVCSAASATPSTVAEPSVTVPLFFADADRLRACAVGDVVDLGGPEGHHAATVRRLTVGEKLDLADGDGLLCSAEVTAVVGRALRARVLTRTQLERPQPRVTVVQALAKGDRDERAVEALTEVGVDAVVPWQASRSVARWDPVRAEKGVSAWRTTAREAAKQTRRPWLVDVHPLESTAAVANRLAATVGGGGQAFVLHETATRPLLDIAVNK